MSWYDANITERRVYRNKHVSICAILPHTVLRSEPYFVVHTIKCLEDLKHSDTSIVDPIFKAEQLEDEDQLKYDKDDERFLPRYIAIVHEDAIRYLGLKIHETEEYIFQQHTWSMPQAQLVKYCNNVLEAGVIDKRSNLYREIWRKSDKWRYATRSYPTYQGF